MAGTTFSWTVPDQKTLNGAKIKVIDLSNPNNVFAASNAFTIRGGFSWNYPVTSAQVIKVGTTEALSWSTFGTIPNVSLEYSVNNGFSYLPVLFPDGITAATGISNTGTFNWKIPNNISQDVYIKIKDSTDADAVQASVKLKIAGILYLDAPIVTSRWGVGLTKQILWHTDGSIANVKLEYSVNNGAWIDLGNALGSAGTKDWLIPASESTNVKVRISDVLTASGSDVVVSGAFKIIGSFSFTAPTGVAIWPVTGGDIANPQQNIVWSTQGSVPSVNLRYSSTGLAPWTLINTLGPIADGGLGGSLAWSVPDAISTNVKIRIEDSADSETFQDSSAFTIRGDLNLTSPVGTEKWGVGSTQGVTWQRNGSIAEAYISYSKNGLAGPWIPIMNPLTGLAPHPNSGSLAWTVPDDMTIQGRVKITNVSGPAVTTQSGANFKIMARFDVLNPDGGEIVNAGGAYTVT